MASWIVVQACTTYDGLTPDSPHAGAAGMSATAGNATAGNLATGGKAGSDVGGNEANGGKGVGGAVNAGGVPSDAAGASMGGEAGSTGVGGAAAGAGDAGMAGAGGSGVECTSAAPDATCSCEPHAGHEYWFCAAFATFAAAENKCKSVGMHLPKVETRAEDDWLFAAAQTHLLGEYFLGATDAATPNEWSWLAGGKFWSGVADGTAFAYANWSANEPNASDDCLVVQSNGPWDDRTCTDQRRYVCETL